jgi:hypothetical protein
MMERYYFIPQFFSRLFSTSPKPLRHTCGPYASHLCAAAHRLKIAGLEGLRKPRNPHSQYLVSRSSKSRVLPLH